MSALVVNEIFRSIQGESTRAGEPCVFVRLTACDLRCTWCDTEYAFHEGTKQTVAEVLDRVEAWDVRLVTVTGGEPLLQKSTPELITSLLDRGRTVLVETGGHRDITGLDSRAIRILDLKAPSSGQTDRMRWGNLDDLRATDEVKIVVRDRIDYDWALKTIHSRGIEGRCPILLSPVHGELDPATLAGWILESGAPVRLQIQLHRLLWPETLRGV